MKSKKSGRQCLLVTGHGRVSDGTCCVFQSKVTKPAFRTVRCPIREKPTKKQ